MSADLAQAAPARAEPRGAGAPAKGGHPTAVVAWVTARKSVRSGLLWGVIFSVYVATQVFGYASSYPTAAQRAQVAGTLGSGSGINALLGQGHQLQTLAGFTEWKCLGALSLLGAVWALLLGTRLLRGEEDAGRWELLIAGQTTRARAAAQGMAGLAAGLGVVWAMTGLTTAVIGQSATIHLSVLSSLLFAVAVVSGGVMFVAVGVLASQVSATRRQAAAYAAGVLGVCFALRVVADSGSSFGWLRWVTPLGWVEELRPLTGASGWPLLPIVALTAVLGSAAVRLAARRDLGAGIVADRSSAAPRTRLLAGPAGLTLRLIRPTVLGWFTAIAVMGFILGADTRQAVKALQSSPSSQHVIARLGGAGDAAGVYLGVSFLMLALLLTLVAAGQVTATRRDEAIGRVEHLLVRPLSRTSWLAQRVVVVVAFLVTGGLVAGLFTWLGLVGQHTGLTLATLVGAGLNVVPPALCLLGMGVLAVGVWPRAASGIAYGVLAWSFLVELVAGTVTTSHWLLDTSLFHQMAPAPATAPDWTSGAVLVCVAVTAAGLGAWGFHRRDLVSE